MKIPCDRRSENTLFSKRPSCLGFVDEKTASKLVRKFGSPLLVGRKSRIRDQLRIVQERLPGVQIHYAVKANSDRTVLSILHDLGAEFDVASLGEIDRIFMICGSLSKAIFSNPCKTVAAIDQAYKHNCRHFVFDCQSELEKLRRIPQDAKLLLRVGVPAGSCRVNLSQRFGASIEQVEQLGLDAKHHHQSIAGIAFHVGSQATDYTDFGTGFEIAAITWRILEGLGHNLEFMNIGGGFPVDYQESLLNIDEYLTNVMKLRDQKFCRVIKEKQVALPIRWMCEPGRILVAGAITLLASVIGVKHLPSGRPCYTIDDGIYGSFSGRYFPPDHFHFFPVPHHHSLSDDRSLLPSMVCGPTCDGGDILGHSQLLPALKIGDLVQVPQMGAYTSVGASRFNGLPITRRVWID